MLRVKVLCLASALSVATVLQIPIMGYAQGGGGVSLEATSGRETTGVLQRLIVLVGRVEIVNQAQQSEPVKA